MKRLWSTSITVHLLSHKQPIHQMEMKLQSDVGRRWRWSGNNQWVKRHDFHAQARRNKHISIASFTLGTVRSKLVRRPRWWNIKLIHYCSVIFFFAMFILALRISIELASFFFYRRSSFLFARHIFQFVFFFLYCCRFAYCVRKCGRTRSDVHCSRFPIWSIALGK